MSKPKPHSADPRIDLLPGQLKPVAEICGFEAIERFIQQYGGTRIYVPSVVISQAIARRCGREVAEVLRQAFGGTYVLVPLAKSLRAAERRQAIESDRRPANEIARELGISVRSVWRIRGERAESGAKAEHGTTGARRALQRDGKIVDLEELIDRAARKPAGIR